VSAPAKDNSAETEPGHAKKGVRTIIRERKKSKQMTADGADSVAAVVGPAQPKKGVRTIVRERRESKKNAAEEADKAMAAAEATRLAKLAPWKVPLVKKKEDEAKLADKP
jgi:hypothetical protein